MQQFIEMVLSAGTPDVPQPLRAELLAIMRTADGMSRLKAYFSAHPGAAITFRSACRENAFLYVESELTRLNGLKNLGALSLHEEKTARIELQGLLDKIEAMCMSGIQRALRTDSLK